MRCITNTGSHKPSSVLSIITAAVLASCNGDDDGAETCLDALPAECAPDLTPDYDSLYKFVFNQRCGAVGAGDSCHSRNGSMGRLNLANADLAYAALVEGETPRVKRGDPSCSPLMKRLVSSDPAYRMPLASDPLPPGLICAIQQWIEAGAER